MAEPLADQIIRKVKQAIELYYRLILVVAPAGAGKTTAFLDVQGRTGAPLVNINLALSRRMLDLTEHRRALHLPRLLREIVGNGDGEMILLDNIEMIFDVGLKQDPLRLLQGLSRNKTVVAAWDGEIISDEVVSDEPSDSSSGSHHSSLHLTYAAPAHPEYRHYPIRDFLVASPNFSDED